MTGHLTCEQVIVDAAKPYIQKQISNVPDVGKQLLVFSAHQGDSLQERAAKVLEYAEKNQDRLGDIAYTLNCRREPLAHRAFAVVDGTWPPEISPVVKPKEAPVVNFVFTGQGAQWAGMGADLMTNYPAFLEDIRAMDKCLKGLPHPPPWTIEGKLTGLR